MADPARRATYGTPDLLLNASHDGNDEGLPLSVPVEGVQAWELHGSPDDHVRLSPAYVLQPVHTIAAWVRLDTRVQGFKPLLAGGNDALVLSPELRPGIIAANGTISRFADSEPLPRNEWLMIVGVGQSRGVTSSQGHFGETRFYVGRARDANLVEAGAVELCAAGLSCSHVSTPTSAFGSVAELAIWNRAVPLDELRSLFASRRGAFGCRCATGATVLAAGLAAAPPPARLWFAPPAGGLVGEVVDAASCAAVDGVDVCLDGAVLATTDALGRYSLSAVPAGTLAFCKAGYAPALHAAHGVMRARLLRADASQRFAAREGAELRTPAGAVLVVAPGSLCTADDSVPFDGEACAALTILDATAPSALHSMPGDFTALGAKGEACQLESFGAAHIALADGAGRELRVRDGAPPLEVRMATAAAHLVPMQPTLF